ncbi:MULTISPECIES: zinc transporter ZntB [Kordiimonas]|jgi:zinc transporter|uniref:Zinc transporter n=1 Tax=Kordiimonas lacus TaxID=637679 RepID=A0A1G7AXR8_9PROT|nr:MULTISPECIES: zinc transporter ZntB [Kordiimonas]SDE19502.1 zinc transporter [Kordiimonas lacus]
MSNSFIIDARYLDPDHEAKSPQDVQGEIDEPIWLHVNVADDGAAEQLAKAAPYMDSAMIEALCAADTRPHVEDFGKEYLIILRGMNMNPEAEPDDMVSLRIWSDGKHVISAERRPVMAVRKLIDKLKASDKPVTASEVVVSLAVEIIGNMAGPIGKLLDDIDELEIAALEGKPGDLRSHLNSLRETVLFIRRYLVPMKQAISQLQGLAQDWLGDKATRRLRHAGDHLARHIEDLDAAREQLQFQHEEMLAAISDKLNRNMYTLSIVAAIFLPLGFLTGLLGINVGGMPGADDATAFWWVAGGCAAIAICQLLYFRRGGWF